MTAVTQGVPPFLLGMASNLMASASPDSSSGMPMAGDDGASAGGGGVQLAIGGGGGGASAGGGPTDGRDSTGADSNGGDSSVNPNGAGGNGGASVALCASCDRCRARKTKCDGARPCGNCAAKYLKKHKLSSIDGVDISEFECVYSPAKRRGPVPGKAGQTRKAGEAGLPGAGGAAVMLEQQFAHQAQLQQQQQQQQQLSAFGALGGVGGLASLSGLAAAGGMTVNAELLQQFEMQKKNVAAAAAGQQQQGLDAQQAQLLGMGLGRREVTDAFGQQQPQHIPSMAGAQQSGETLDLQRLLQQQQPQQQNTPMAIDTNGTSSTTTGGGGANDMAAQVALQHQLTYLQQLQHHQDHQQLQLHQRLEQQQPPQLNESIPQQLPSETRSQRPRISGPQSQSGSKSTGDDATRIAKHLVLLDQSNPEGNRLRSFYSLSIDELFKLPPIPTDEEYLARLKNANPGAAVTAPHSDLAALRAARFAEVALGALVNNQISLAMELSNATVMCLRQCVKEPAHPSCIYDVARGYLLHGIFRSFRGDLERYFKYRRVCLTHVSKLDNVPNVEALIAAISFHDSWAYMLYNATESELPQIDSAIPPVPPKESKTGQDGGNGTDQKYGISSAPSQVASNPANQMWIQGAPPVFINNEASAVHRSVDALACSIRSCCDQANSQFQMMAREVEGGGDSSSSTSNAGDGQRITATTSAVMANSKELCSRNMVLSAYALLEQHEASAACQGVAKNVGHHMLVSAMDAFLEGGDEDEAGGFTDSQIQSLLSVCNRAVEQPLLLFMPGPTYHMVSNAAILLCHLLNGMYSSRVGGEKPGPMEEALFDEVLDTFIAVRKLLSIHRRKLPARLRCHSIPRPKGFRGMGIGSTAGASSSSSSDGSAEPFIDLGDTLMCPCRGCQGFVLMACSPCVAAERAAAAAERNSRIENGDIPPSEGGVMDICEFDKELQELGAEFDVADDSLLDVLSRMIST